MELKKVDEKKKKKKGSVGGAIGLIIGTTIGSGILALPIKTSPAGLLPSSISLTVCWAFLLVEALLLVEINVGLMNKKKKKFNENEDELEEIISIKTMAQETLGDWGAILVTFTYIFFGYSSMVAYCSKSGEILNRLTNLPQSLSAFFFTVLFTILVSVGGTRTTDQINRWLTASMIGLLVGIEVLAFASGSGLAGFEDGGDWAKVPEAIPVMIFSLVYHDLAPVLCAYLGGDIGRIRTSILVGSVVPLLTLLAWNAIALGLFAQTDQLNADPVDLLLSVRWSGVPLMVEAFSLLAVGTSLIGTLLSFSEFLKEQITNSTTLREKIEDNMSFSLMKWWKRRRSKIRSIAATSIIVAPSLLISTMFPDAFSTATNIAGGYCMTMLYGILPPAMAWAAISKEERNNGLSWSRPAIIGVGLVACTVVAEQILQDLALI
ncbi:tyrosine-specific transport system-like [Impatiens glandulifera]|uniref:tyrosine-specific transport system-like n=1 Tax=Impatiens glandulifera TaxID=253017 RepID=UPI001FB114FE|nr:tyrosine-specific transport system-like [Impatiens glandulifera]